MRSANRKCPICHNETVNGLHYQKFILPEGHPLTDGYEVVCCSSCGFVYADTAVSQAAYDRFYEQFSKYEDTKTGTGGIENPWDRTRQEETANQIADFLKNPLTSILDIGCANGGLLNALKSLGYSNLFGIDPSPLCVANTRNLGIDAEKGSLSQPLSREPFDCVILSHTLEHIQDLEEAGQQVRDLVKEDGYIYIEVPDATRYVDFVDAPFQDFNTEHINHFSLVSLRNYIRKHGFKLLKSGEKIIPASADKPYPAIYIFAQNTVDGKDINKDYTLLPKIEAYIGTSRKILEMFEEKIRAELSESNRVIVWGTGQLTMKLLAETSLSQAEIIAFVDSNPVNQGTSLGGAKVVSPESISGSTEPILVGTTLHQQSVIDQIHTMGLSNRLILLKE